MKSGINRFSPVGINNFHNEEPSQLYNNQREQKK